MLQEKAALMDGAHVWTVLIQGYADRSGAPEYNRALARRRADAVKQFLVGLAGYLGPPVLGVGGAMLLSTGRVRPLLWLSLFLLVCALFMAEGWRSGADRRLVKLPHHINDEAFADALVAAWRDLALATARRGTQHAAHR